MARSIRAVWRGVMVAVAVAGLLAGCGPSVGERGGDGSKRLLGAGHETREVELSTDAQWLSVAVQGDLVYVLGQPMDANQIASPDRYLLAIDRRTGEQRWRSEFVLPNTGISIYASELTAAGGVLLFRSDAMIVALSPQDGSVLWHIEDSSSQLRYVGVLGERLITASYPNVVTTWSLKDGTQAERWDLQGYTFTGYGGAGEMWLSNDGKQLVAVVDPSGGMGTELAVITLDLQNPGASPHEVVRNPVRYDVTETLVGPVAFAGGSMVTYGRSDHVARVTVAPDKVTIEAWHVLDGEQAWAHEIPVDQETYYYSTAYYAPRLLMTPTHGLVQEPGSEGVLLRNVLRLHLHELSDFDREWTNVLPTQHYVASMLELPAGRMLLQTRTDEGTFNERWYAFDRDSGALLWASDDQQFVGSTLAVASDGKAVARLMTANWEDRRLFIDEF